MHEYILFSLLIVLLLKRKCTPISVRGAAANELSSEEDGRWTAGFEPVTLRLKSCAINKLATAGLFNQMISLTVVSGSKPSKANH